MRPSYATLELLSSSPASEPFLLKGGNYKWPEKRPVHAAFSKACVKIASGTLELEGSDVEVRESLSDGWHPSYYLKRKGSGWASVHSFAPTGSALFDVPNLFSLHWAGADGTEGMTVHVPSPKPAPDAAKVLVYGPTGALRIGDLNIIGPVEGVALLSHLTMLGGLFFHSGSPACGIHLAQCDLQRIDVSLGNLLFVGDSNVVSGEIHVDTLHAGTSGKSTAESLRNVSVVAKTVVFNPEWLAPLGTSCCQAPKGLTTADILYCGCGAQTALPYSPSLKDPYDTFIS